MVSIRNLRFVNIEKKLMSYLNILFRSLLGISNPKLCVSASISATAIIREVNKDLNL